MPFELPKPDQRSFDDLISCIDKGIIKLPKFQRNFVWDVKKSAYLIDSIIKGYPIGTFILWRTKDRLSDVRNLGNQKLPDAEDGTYVEYVLDGQQRLASLYVIAKGGEIEDEGGKKTSYKNIFLNLDVSDDSDDIVSVNEPAAAHITVYDLLKRRAGELSRKYKEDDYLNRIDEFYDRIKQYMFSIILLNNASIDKAMEVFSRLNTTGTELRLFEIMAAKTYEEGKFDLRSKYDELNDELADNKYGIPPAQLLQCIALNIKGQCTRKAILQIKKEEIMRVWDKTIGSIKYSVDYFKGDAFRIPSSKLLPYPALMVSFSCFFYENEKEPTEQQSKYLETYFWRAALSRWFTSSVETKLASDRDIMLAIRRGNPPEYGNDFIVKLQEKNIREHKFQIGESISKAILCIMAYHEPKSFKNGAKITLDASNLHRSNSRNYHHIFPKAFLRKQGVNENRMNLIANITPVGDSLNKEMRDKPPSEYMEKFKGPNLSKIMNTHLIDDLAEYGVWDDDYDRFIEKRSRRMWQELESRFNPNLG